MIPINTHKTTRKFEEKAKLFPNNCGTDLINRVRPTWAVTRTQIEIRSNIKARCKSSSKRIWFISHLINRGMFQSHETNLIDKKTKMAEQQVAHPRPSRNTQRRYIQNHKLRTTHIRNLRPMQ
jgi:hypothetical protein